MRRLLMTVLTVFLTALVATQFSSAEARRYQPSDTDRSEWSEEAQSERPQRSHTRRHHSDDDSSSSSRHNVGGRPGAWCGWYMRTQKGGGPDLNLAWNWSKWGHSSEPQVGAVVVWRHHVGEITGRASNGQWIVKSGNDGGRVRERARSVSGAVFRMG